MLQNVDLGQIVCSYYINEKPYSTQNNNSGLQIY